MHMNLCFRFAILTFVLSHFAFAAPHEDAPSSSPDAARQTETQEPKDTTTIVVTPPPHKETSEKALPSYFYPYLQSYSPRFGLAFDSDKMKDGEKFLYAMGFNYMFKRYRSPQLEIGVDLIIDFGGLLHASRRYIYNERESFRPFFKIGGAHRVEGGYGFASILRLKNYYALGSIGMERLWRSPMSTRIEVQGLITSGDYMVLALLGYSWGW